MEALVLDPRTHLYFDTSFLMLLAKLGEPARRQFFAWCEEIGTERFHVPLWAAHEFFKHRLLDTVVKELKSDISTFDKAAKQLFGSLQVYASDQLFGFAQAGSMVVDEFKRTVQPLRAVLRLATSSKASAAGVQEVAEFIDRLLLPGSLDALIEDIETNERVRNRGTIPPAFKDAHKRGDKGDGADTPVKADNSFGDLVFWREVLRHAKRARCAALVVLTKDRKNDWYLNRHGIEGVEKEFHKRVTAALPVPTAHPLLVREAHDFGAGTLDLLDPMYCGVLLERSGTAYERFGAAVIDIELADPPSGKSLKAWASRFGPAARLLGAERDGGQLDDDSENEGDVDEEPFDALTLDKELLRASGTAGGAAKAQVEAIGSGDLATRAAAFASLGKEELGAWESRDLAALGRLAAQLAQDEVPPAKAFIQTLRDLGPEFPAAVRLPIYFGALGSLFLTPDLERAAVRGSRSSMTLLDMSTSPEMQDATDRIIQVLADLSVPSAIRSTSSIEVEVVTQGSADNKSPADLLAMKIDGTNLMTDTQPEESLRFSRLLEKPAGLVDAPVGALIDIVCRYHLIPRQRVTASVDTDAIVRVPEFAGIELED